VIELSIQIMLEELGPNLWEHKLERCVDYGHTFSKIMEMIPGVDIMHGEAVNVDGKASVQAGGSRVGGKDSTAVMRHDRFLVCRPGPAPGSVLDV
jgi:3-dehydroquinate synthetase